MTGIEQGMAIGGLMLLLMALRVHIAMAMLVAGSIGYIWIAGSATLLNYMKTAAWARYSIYDLSVVPLFLLMGQFATHGGLSKALFRRRQCLYRPLAGRHGDGGSRSLRLIRRHLRFLAGNGRHHGSGGAARTAQPQVLGAAGHCGNRGWRHPRHPDSALGAAGDLCHPHRTEHCQALRRGHRAGLDRDGRLHAGHRHHGAHGSHGGTRGRAFELAGEARRTDGNLAGTGDFRRRESAASMAAFSRPTEAASIGALATGYVAWRSGGLRKRGFLECVYGTAQATAMIFLILLGADIMNVFLALTQMPVELSKWVAGLGYSPLVILIVILCIYVVLGCIMDSLSMIMLTVPIFFPIVMGLDYWGMDLESKAIWFGILSLMAVEIGMITPPVGLNVFIISSMAKETSMAETFKGIVPFLMSDIGRIALLVMVPSLALVALRF